MKKIFFYYLKPYYLRMAGGFLIKFVGTIMDLFLPWALAYMIDTVIPAHRKEEILLWGLFMAGCSVLAAVMNVLANRMASRVAGDAVGVIREDLFGKVMYLSGEQMDELTRPSLISRLTTDTYHVHQMLGRIQRLGVRAPILLIGGIGMTLMLDTVLAGVLFATLPLLIFVVVFVSKRSIPLFAGLQESLDRFVRVIREDIAGIRVIKALSKEDYERERFEQVNKEVAERERKANLTAAITSPAMNMLLNLGMAAVILAGAVRVNAGLTEVGKILAFMTYFTIILNALLSISRMFVVMSKAAASAERIGAVLEAEDEREWKTEAFNNQKREKETPHVSFEHVWFSYGKALKKTDQQRTSHLSDVSFSLKHGETLGIIGSTGSGKSTVVNLLMRFYDIEEGCIRIDGQDICTMDLKTLRKQFGAVFQNDSLFENSIYDNVDMGRGIGREQAEKAIQWARAEEFVKNKGGIYTKIDVRGANLSGGQKQRLLIARAFLGGSKILILDDSSSALDYETEADLQREIKEHFAGVTCIVIAQRIRSVMEADRILVLEEGKTAGYGTHEELMRNCKIYQEIWESQKCL